MAFFKDTAGGPREASPVANDAPQRMADRDTPAELRRVPDRVEPKAEARPTARAELKESVIAAELTLEGKIEGIGHVRIAGRFKGDIHVQGNVTIEQGAHVAGQVRAKHVVIAGELQGNIDGAERVELQQTGVLTGDLKAGSLIVAAGSRMRGQVEFGWDDKASVVGSIPQGRGSGG
jgi:cytoskeletal protein CcmA (bactofilin family)